MIDFSLCFWCDSPDTIHYNGCKVDGCDPYKICLSCIFRHGESERMDKWEWRSFWEAVTNPNR